MKTQLFEIQKQQQESEEETKNWMIPIRIDGTDGVVSDPIATEEMLGGEE